MTSKFNILAYTSDIYEREKLLFLLFQFLKLLKEVGKAKEKRFIRAARGSVSVTSVYVLVTRCLPRAVCLCNCSAPLVRLRLSPFPLFLKVDNCSMGLSISFEFRGD